MDEKISNAYVPMNSSMNILYRDGTSTTVSLSPVQTQVDSLVGGFEQMVTEWQTLAAMTAGGLAYRAGRIGVMGLGSGSALRVASVGLGLTAEVSTFEFTHRGLESLHPPHLGDSNLWRWNGNGGLRQGLLRSLVSFGALKGAGHLAQGENLVSQHLLQDTAMVLGHQVTGVLGIAPRPTGSLAEQFLHAEATNLQIGAGMALAHGLAPGLGSFERGLDVFASKGTALGFSLDPQVLTGHRPAWATPLGGALLSEGSPRPFSPILAMTASKGQRESPSLSEEGSGVSGERTRNQHPAIDLFLRVIEKEERNPEEVAAAIPREEWNILAQLPGSSMAPRGRDLQDVFLGQTLSGPLTLEQKFQALKNTFGDPHYMGRVFAGCSGNTVSALFSNFEYIQHMRPGETLESLVKARREELDENLSEARVDVLKALSILGEMYRIVGETENGDFLRGAVIGKNEFGARGIRTHYRRFENDILKGASPELLSQVGVASVPSYRELMLRAWRFGRRNR